MMLGPQSLLSFADIVILTLVLLLVLYMLMQQRMATSLPIYGRFVLLAGLFLAAFTNFAEMFAPIPIIGAGNISEIPDGIPGWIFWVGTRGALLMITVGLYVANRHRVILEQSSLVSSARMRAAESQAVQSEERFRSLFQTTTNAIYCYKFEPPLRMSLPVEAQIRASLDAVLVECNRTFAEDLGYVKPTDIIGTTFSYLDGAKDEESHARFITDLIASGYRLSDYERIYKSVDGEDRAISVSVTGIVQDGFLQRMWGVERNILEARRAKTALYRRRAFQTMLTDISSRLIKAPLNDADKIILESLAEVCRFIGGNRLSMSWVDMDQRIGEVMYNWHEADGPPIEEISFDLFPYLGEKLTAGEAVAVSDIDDMPAEAATDVQILKAVGMKSFVFFPLAVAGEIVGILAMANDAEYCDWTKQDMLDVRVFGELFANYVLRLRQRRALDVALDSLRTATERLQAENVYLRTEIKLNHDFEGIVGNSDALRRSLQMVEQVADTMTPVLILGETGTGKELIARALHEYSSRRHRPLVKVNCAALPANLIESELFGFEKGAFTSADASKRGRFDLAHGSTLFLDEIGEIPVELQAKLLRVLQEGEFERLGGNKTIKVDVRIIAATNRDLWTACEAGEFRSDLYYRINTFPIELPALRERGDDIRLLAEHFAKMHAQRLGRDISQISANMMRQLENYHWPGNVRELEGVIQRALISSSGTVLELGQPLAGHSDLILAEPGSHNLSAVERDHITTILEECGWKIAGKTGAAAALDVPPSTLRSKMKKLGIQRPSQ